MKKNVLRNLLIVANLFMITLCYYSWNFKLKPQEQLDESYGAVNERELSHQNAGRRKGLKKNVLSQVKVFQRGGDKLKFDQPWTIPVTKIWDNFEELNKNQKYLVSNFRLGNLMFQFASLRALAEENSAKLILPSDCLLRRAFGNFDDLVILMEPSAFNKFLISRHGKIQEYDDCCKYHPEIRLFGGRNLEESPIEVLNGYFQSFKYFHPKHEQLIRKDFSFLPGVLGEAENILEDAKYKNWNAELNIEEDEGNDKVIQLPNAFDNEYYFVGLHVRHGFDMTMHSRNLKHGHLVAPFSFYQKAINHFVEKFKWRKVIFIIASDDIEWVKRNFRGESETRVIFLESRQREVDMATLSLCNATVLSTGTFSWWISYLSRGPTVYYSGWPREGSELDQMVVKSDYFLPEWTPME